MTRSRIWTLGTIGVVVAVLVGGWFLLVSPTRANAADIEQQAVSQGQANAQLASTIEQLKVQSQDLPAQEAKIAQFRQRIPASPQLPAFIRELSSIAKESNVVLVSMEPSAPAPLTVQATATDASGSVTLSGTTTTSAVQFVAAKVTVSGGYFNTEQFFNKLEKLQRSFLVTGFDISNDTATDAQAGDVVTNVQVRVFFTGDLSTTPTSGTTAPTTTPAN